MAQTISKATEIDRILEAGLWHFTTPSALKAIMRHGSITPNHGQLRPQHSLSVHSCCYRLGSVALFDPLNPPQQSWLRTWMRIHKPLTVGIRLERDRLEPRLLSYKDTRQRGKGGVILKGEVCHVGDIPMEWCTGFLFLTATGRLRYRFIKAPTTAAALAGAVREVRRLMNPCLTASRDGGAPNLRGIK